VLRNTVILSGVEHFACEAVTKSRNPISFAPGTDLQRRSQEEIPLSTQDGESQEFPMAAFAGSSNMGSFDSACPFASEWTSCAQDDNGGKYLGREILAWADRVDPQLPQY